jgi:hypothetical protein
LWCKSTVFFLICKLLSCIFLSNSCVLYQPSHFLIVTKVFFCSSIELLHIKMKLLTNKKITFLHNLLFSLVFENLFLSFLCL